MRPTATTSVKHALCSTAVLTSAAPRSRLRDENGGDQRYQPAASRLLERVPPVTAPARLPCVSLEVEGLVDELHGVISGLALRSVRSGLGLTQAALAEAVAVASSTVKSWETGRRPLARARVEEVERLRFTLRVLGAEPGRLAGLDQALRADWLLSRSLEPNGPHPLAHHVLTREMTQMLWWPLTGCAPAAFANAANRQVLGAGQRAEVYRTLRASAERSPSPLLRRNAYYLLTADPGSRDWLRVAAGRERRRMPRLDRWTPEWVLHRSLAVAEAMAGDRQPMRLFLDVGLRSDDTLAARRRR